MLADGVCDVPLQQASPALKCSVGTPNWSPATTACTDASYMVPLELPAATVDLEDSQWPSVHEADRQLAAERGWDFVSEASDEDGSWVEELDARLAPESPEAGGPPGELGEGGAGSAVWLVTSSAPPPPEDAEAPKRTFAQAVLAGPWGPAAFLPAAGCRVPGAGGPGKQDARPFRCSGATADDDEKDEGAAEGFDPRASKRGWKKQHKASWSSRQQRRTGQQALQRAEQSCRTRGWLDEEDEEEHATA